MPKRRTHHILAIAAVFLTALSPTRAHSQFTTATSSTHHWLAVGFGGGEVIPTGNSTEGYRSGFQGQAYVVVNLGILPELRFNFGYQRFNFKDQVLNSLGYPTAASGYNSVLAGIAGTRIDLIRGPVRPYLTLGVGAFNVKTTLDTSGTGSSYSPVTAAKSNIQFGLDGGAGLAVHVGRVEAFTEGRVQNVFTKNGFIKSTKQITAVPVTFGFLFSII